MEPELGDFLLGKQWQGQEMEKDIAGAVWKLAKAGDRQGFLREGWRGRGLEGILWCEVRIGEGQSLFLVVGAGCDQAVPLKYGGEKKSFLFLPSLILYYLWRPNLCNNSSWIRQHLESAAIS